MPLVDIGFSSLKDAQGHEIDGAEALITTGPTIWVDIGLDLDFDYGGFGQPKSQALGIPALVDTGATESCIDDALAQKIGLPLIDRATVGGIAGSAEMNVYMAHIWFPSLGTHQWGRFSGVHLADGDQPHQALIGRTLLRNMMLVYDGRTGSVTLAF